MTSSHSRRAFLSTAAAVPVSLAVGNLAAGQSCAPLAHSVPAEPVAVDAVVGLHESIIGHDPMLSGYFESVEQAEHFGKVWNDLSVSAKKHRSTKKAKLKFPGGDRFTWAVFELWPHDWIPESGTGLDLPPFARLSLACDMSEMHYDADEPWLTSREVALREVYEHNRATLEDGDTWDGQFGWAVAVEIGRRQREAFASFSITGKFGTFNKHADYPLRVVRPTDAEVAMLSAGKAGAA